MSGFDVNNIARVFGHRGAAADAPENTLAGAREAKRQGAAWIEFDVQLTADLVPVIVHDATLDRTTDRTGVIASLNWPELQAADAGAWFAPRFAGERIPSLQQMLDEAAALGLGCNVELKAAPGQAAALARAVAPVLAATSVPLLVSSFDPASLAALRELAPDLPMGGLIDRNWADPLRQADALGLATLHLAASRAAEFVGLGRPVLAYTVNDLAVARDLWQNGVAGLFSDRPGLLLQG